MSTRADSSSSAALLSRIHQITLPTPFPVGPVHTYLMTGEPLTLVDTGPYTPQALQALRAGLHDLGYAVADLERIIVTHAHSDHFGLVGELAAASDALLWGHALAQPVIEGWEDFLAQRSRFWHDLLQASGTPQALAEASSRLYGSFRRLQTNAPLDHLLAEGETVEMAGATWQTLYCPGHSSSLICFHQPESGVLLGNDHLLAHISSNAIVEPPPLGEPVRRRPLVDYWNSLCRVHDLAVQLVLTGHGEQVSDAQGLISRRFSFYEQRLERLRAELRGGTRSVWQLAEAIFRKLDTVDVFLAASEIIGHLDVLEEKGEVVVHTDDEGVWRYELAPGGDIA